MAKISIYTNLKASSVDSRYWDQKLANLFFRHQVSFRKPISMAELKKEISLDKKLGCDLIITIGGDGTINAIIQELVGSDITIFPIPAGTANDLTMELNIPRNLSVISKIYHSKAVKQVDLIKVNNKFMITNGGIGIASKVVQEINELRLVVPFFNKIMKMTKSGIYATFLVKSLVNKNLKYQNLSIESSDFKNPLKTYQTPLLLICNQEKLGKNFMVARGTRHDDGKFAVKIFIHRNLISFAKDLLLMRLGKNVQSPNIIYFETDNLLIREVDKNKKIKFFGDGDILVDANEIMIQTGVEKQSVFYFEKKLMQYHSYDLHEIEEV